MSLIRSATLLAHRPPLSRELNRKFVHYIRVSVSLICECVACSGQPQISTAGSVLCAFCFHVSCSGVRKKNSAHIRGIFFKNCDNRNPKQQTGLKPSCVVVFVKDLNTKLNVTQSQPSGVRHDRGINNFMRKHSVLDSIRRHARTRVSLSSNV